MTFDLSALSVLAPALILGAFSVFCRVAAAIALLPGFGERGIPMRIKLGLALALSFVLWPLAQTHVGTIPEGVSAIAAILFAEIAAGLLFGLWIRFLIMALQIAGAIMGQQLSLSALFSGPTVPDPETSFATILSLAGITLVLVSGLHIQMFAAIVHTYNVLPWGEIPSAQGAALSITERGAMAIELGLQLSLPFVVASFIYNLCLGAMNRAMPQLLVSLVGAPALVGGGLILLMLALPLMLNIWRGGVEAMLIGMG